MKEKTKTGEGSRQQTLKLSVETDEERRGRLENDAATKRLRLAPETDEERRAKKEWNFY